jgi:acyl-CoA thioesterase I
MYRSLLRSMLLLALVGFAPESLSAQPPAIMVFGDSLSAGYGLPQGKGWVDLLQRRLQHENYAYRVVNASISGETTLGGRNRLADALAQHHPRIVILELGANDGLRGQAPDAMRQNLFAMVRAAQAAKTKVLLVGMRVPPNYGPAYTEKFHASFVAVANQTRTPLVPFLLEGFADRRDLFQADGIHPDVEAQSMILDNVWGKLRPMLTRPAQDRWRAAANVLVCRPWRT